MLKNAIIKIQGSQGVESKGNDSIELTTYGTIEYSEVGCKITYEESELTGMKGTTTVILVERQGKITLNRFGTTNSCLVFEEGQKHISYYDTAEGAFSISVYTNYLEADINHDKGELEIEYALEIDGKMMGINSIILNFECPNGGF